MDPRDLVRDVLAFNAYRNRLRAESPAAKQRIDLTGIDLRGADRARIDLSFCDLQGAYLVKANLSRSRLTGADLSGANLEGAKLGGASLLWPTTASSLVTTLETKGAAKVASAPAPCRSRHALPSTERFKV